MSKKKTSLDVISERDVTRIRDTRFLGPRAPAAPMQPRKTDRLDLRIPRQLRFIITGENGKSFDVPVKKFMVIGRAGISHDHPVDVDFQEYSGQELGVSRYHATITISADGLRVKDVNSTNGTLLNGRGLRPLQSYRLRHGDELQFGKLKVRVLFLGLQL